MLLRQSHGVSPWAAEQRDCTEYTDVCFPSRKHWGLESTDQKLRLGSISGGVHQGTDVVPGLHTRKVSCVNTHRAGCGHIGASAEFGFLQSSLH